jgi:hypothetical protein
MSTKDYVTWADFHPEVAEIFDSMWDYKKIDWPCEMIDTGVGPVLQPSVAMGPGQELFTVGRNGQVFHGQDSGKTWALLCTSPPEINPKVPEGFKLWPGMGGKQSIGGIPVLNMESTGIGVSERGTLILTWCMSYNDGRTGKPLEDETFHVVSWMTRSEDRGKTWTATELLDSSPYDKIVDQCTVIQLSDGRLMVPLRVEACSRPGKPVSISEDFFRSFIYTSSDDGKTWPKFSKFTDHSPEPHLLEMPSGKIVAALRYQRSKVPEDQPKLGGCHYDVPGQRNESITGGATAVGRTLFQHTAFTFSEDGGKTWATPRLITGTLQQSGSLVRLSDGTLALIFGRWGQRFMLSYDEGKTWSKTVYSLNGTGEYARSVALEDDTIVTLHDSIGVDYDVKKPRPNRLGVLRWKAPPRKEVEQHGFFTPREVETGLQ